MLEDLWFRSVGVPYEGGASETPSLRFDNASTGTLRNSLFTDGGSIQVSGGASPLIESNLLRNGPNIYMDGSGNATVVRDNTVVDNKFVALYMLRERAALIVGNTFDGSRALAVIIGFGGSAGMNPILRNNVITRAPVGIEIGLGAAPTLERNRIDVEGTAIHLVGPSQPIFIGNTICGLEAIVTQRDPEMPSSSLDGNEVCELVASN